MKTIHPLKLEEMSLEQKIGFLIAFRKSHNTTADDLEFLREMIKKRCVGAVQIAVKPGCEDDVREIVELADYPILIGADMEQGFQLSSYHIPSMMGLSITNDEELAYQFATVTAIGAKKLGYNMIWSPVVDLLSGGSRINVGRRISDDKEKVGRIASAVLRGYYDNGVLATAKHWPTPYDVSRDGHLFKNFSQLTEKDLRENVFYPYRYAMKHAGLAGIMTGHTTFVNVDPEYPGTLSEKLISIVREEGFDGFMITDSFSMSGIMQKFGEDKLYGRAIKAGNDMILHNFKTPFRKVYEMMMNAYQTGVISEERLNDAVRHVLAAQELAMKPATATEVSEYQKECFTRIAQQSVCDVVDEGVSHALDKATKKLFLVLLENPYTGEDGGTVEIADNNVISYEQYPAIKEMILSRFPDSDVQFLNRCPNSAQMSNASYRATQVDEVVFITYVRSGAYTGSENLTEPIVTLMQSVEEKLGAVIHVGSPLAMERIPHVPRLVLSVGGGVKAIENGLSILNGEYIPKGKLPIHLSLA